MAWKVLWKVLQATWSCCRRRFAAVGEAAATTSGAGVSVMLIWEMSRPVMGCEKASRTKLVDAVVIGPAGVNAMSGTYMLPIGLISTSPWHLTAVKAT